MTINPTVNLRTLTLLLLLPLLLLVLATPQVDAHGMVRREPPGSSIASSITVPAGAQWLFIGSTLADVTEEGASPGSAARMGDTAAQARSILGKINAELTAAGFAKTDIVKMEVYLVADPAKGGTVDLMGLLSAYTNFFGKKVSNLPMRSTVEVAGLPIPGALVQIAVTAARSSHPEHQ